MCAPISRDSWAMRIKLDHVAIAVSDLESAIRDYEALGLSPERIENVPTQKADVAFLDVGGAHIELVAPTDPSSSVARSIDKRGEGLHHICLEVEDIELALAALKAKGVTLVNPEPVPGAGGSRVAFIHPKSMRGVLVELVQKV